MPLGYDVPFPVIPSQSADWRGNPSLCRGGRLCPPCMTNAATGKRIATPVTRSLVRNDSASRCRGRRPRRPTPQGRTTLSVPCHRRRNPFLCAGESGLPRRFAPRSKCPWGTPRNDAVCRGRRPAVERSGTNALGVRRPVPCHSEPVRRLAWESVSL